MNTSTPKILVVDDNKLDVTTLIYTLKKEGYDVTYSSNGQEAIEQASITLFDLIISDLYMPLMDGNELIKHIRTKPEYRHIPFLFLSGEREEETWVRNLEDGADDFITKPFNHKTLSSKIKAHLRRSFHKKTSIANSRKKNLVSNIGKFIYCKSDDFSLAEKNINCEVLTVKDISEISEIDKENNIWAVLIDENTNWAIENIENIKKIISPTPIYVIISEKTDNNLYSRLMAHNINGFVRKDDREEIMVFEINNIIQNEIIIKEKYISELKMAANNSPTRFDNEYRNSFADFFIDVKHKAYGELAGGDFYEIFNINADDKIIIIGDVMGKKWDAWFFVSAYLAYIRSTIHVLSENKEIDFVKEPRKFLEIINNFIYKDLKLSDAFTTLSIISISTKCSKVRIASAGALRPFYLSKDNISQINIVGTLLGVVDNIEYQQYEHDFAYNDKLIFFTDGYSEAVDSKTKEMIDENSLKEILEEKFMNNSFSTSDFENEIVRKHNITEFDDDRTLLIISKIENNKN